MTEETNPSTVLYFKGFGIVILLPPAGAVDTGAQHDIPVHPVAGVIGDCPAPQGSLHTPVFPALAPVPLHTCAEAFSKPTEKNTIEKMAVAKICFLYFIIK
jgi:hypothetical protein